MSPLPRIAACARQAGQDIINLTLSSLRREGVLETAYPAPPAVVRLPADDTEGGEL